MQCLGGCFFTAFFKLQSLPKTQMYKQKDPHGCAIVYLQNISWSHIYRKRDSFSTAGGHYSELVARPRCRLSGFDKQIQEKHIHEKPNLSNLLAEHSARPETRHPRTETQNRRLRSCFICRHRVAYTHKHIT